MINLINNLRQPAISIIIPCFNHAHYIGTCLQSALKQTYQPTEIIVIDDGSEDNLEHTLRPFKSRIKLIKEKHSGLSVARNLGFHIAKGYYVLPLDADDFISPFYLERAVDILECSEASIAYPDIIKFGLENGIYHHIEYNFEELCKANYMVSCSLIKRSAWKAVRLKNGIGYDPYISFLGGYEDHLFYLECGALGYYGKRIPDELFFYRRVDNSMIDKARKNFALIRNYIAWKMFYLYGIRL